MLPLFGKDHRAKTGQGPSKFHDRKQGLSLTARRQKAGKEGSYYVDQCWKIFLMAHGGNPGYD